MKFNPKLENFTPYCPNQGDEPIVLDCNEVWFSPNRRFFAKFVREIQDLSYNRYPDPTASELRRAFAKAYRVRPEQVVCGNGSDELLNLIVETFCSKDDLVVVTEPEFSMYAFYARLMECRIETVKKREDLTVDVEALIETCRTGEARILFLSNPCNPTSLALDRKQAAKLVSGLPDTLVVLDEAYMDFTDKSMLSEIRKFDNLIILRTLSKAFGMAAVRLGFAVADTRICELLNTTRSPYNVNALTQIAGRIALSMKHVTDANAESVVDGRITVYQALQHIREAAKGDFEISDGEGNFLYIRTSKARQIDAYLKKRGVRVRAYPDALRITVGAPEENQSLIACLDEIASALFVEEP